MREGGKESLLLFPRDDVVSPLIKEQGSVFSPLQGRESLNLLYLLHRRAFPRRGYRSPFLLLFFSPKRRFPAQRLAGVGWTTGKTPQGNRSFFPFLFPLYESGPACRFSREGLCFFPLNDRHLPPSPSRGKRSLSPEGKLLRGRYIFLSDMWVSAFFPQWGLCGHGEIALFLLFFLM